MAAMDNEPAFNASSMGRGMATVKVAYKRCAEFVINKTVIETWADLGGSENIRFFCTVKAEHPKARDGAVDYVVRMELLRSFCLWLTAPYMTTGELKVVFSAL